MKKTFLISVVLIGIILFSSCFVSRNLSIEMDSINKCAELLRQYGYVDYNSETEFAGNSPWGHPTYVQRWYFKKGDDTIYIAWFSGDVDSKKPNVFGYNMNASLVNEIRALGVGVANMTR